MAPLPLWYHPIHPRPVASILSVMPLHQRHSLSPPTAPALGQCRCSHASTSTNDNLVVVSMSLMSPSLLCPFHPLYYCSSLLCPFRQGCYHFCWCDVRHPAMKSSLPASLLPTLSLSISSDIASVNTKTLPHHHLCLSNVPPQCALPIMSGKVKVRSMLLTQIKLITAGIMADATPIQPKKYRRSNSRNKNKDQDQKAAPKPPSASASAKTPTSVGSDMKFLPNDKNGKVQ